MKTWKFLVICILCCSSFIGWCLIGCAEDQCEDACDKIGDCGALILTGTSNVDDCKNKCLDNFREVRCVSDCDTDLSCGDYARCVSANCNPTP